MSDDEITIKDNEEETAGYLPPNPKNLQGKKIRLCASNNAGKTVRARRQYTLAGVMVVSTRRPSVRRYALSHLL